VRSIAHPHAFDLLVRVRPQMHHGTACHKSNDHKSNDHISTLLTTNRMQGPATL
jgi:hypothetical protein